MSSKKIYLVRHGQTDFNKRGIIQGSRVDSSLNETGRRQAEAFYQHYKNTRFDKIYISKLKRTAESVKNFIEDGIPVEAFTGLNEISWGENDGMIIPKEQNHPYWEIVSDWKKGNIKRCIEGGESPVDVHERQVPVLDEILSRDDEQTILICMHGRAMRILLSYIINGTILDMDAFGHHNLGLYLLSYENQCFTIEKANDLEHLEDNEGLISHR